MIELQIKNFRGHNNGLYLFENLEAADYMVYLSKLGIDKNQVNRILDNCGEYHNHYCDIRVVEKSEVKNIGKIKKGQLVWLPNAN